MMGHVVFAVVMGTLLCEAMTVPPRSSVPCVVGAVCQQGGSVSIINNLVLCCPQPNMSMSMVGSVNGQTICRCTSYQGVFITDPNFNATAFQATMNQAMGNLRLSMARLSSSLQAMGQSIGNSMANFGQRLSTSLANMFG